MLSFPNSLFILS